MVSDRFSTDFRPFSEGFWKDLPLSTSCRGSTSCRDVLEAVAAGTPELWRRARPVVLPGAVAAARWDLEAFSYEAPRAQV